MKPRSLVEIVEEQRQKDQVAKAFSRKERNHTPGGILSGVSRKFTAVQVIEIRRRVKAGEPIAAIAREYEVEESTINSIVTRKSYQWVREVEP